MQLNVNLPEEVEAALRRRAAAAGQDVETFITCIVSEEVQDDCELPASRKRPLSHEEFVKKLDEIIRRHGVRVGKFDDSRESIYAGCSE